MLILKRFGSVLVNPKFCAQILWKEDSLKPSWRFWWFWNAALTLVLGGAAFFILQAASVDVENFFKYSIPEFEVHIEQGRLKTTLEDPKILATEREVIILDTKKAAYTPEVLKSYDYGLFITEDRFTLRSPSTDSNLVLDFSNFPDQDWSKEKILKTWQSKKTALILGLTIVGVLFFWLLVSGLSLVLALFLALFTSGIGKLFRLEPWVFSKNMALWMHYLVLFNYLQVSFAFLGISPLFALGIAFLLATINLVFLIRMIRAIA